MQVHAPLRNERVKPEAKLTHVHIPVRPVAPSGGKASLMEPLATDRGEAKCFCFLLWSCVSGFDGAWRSRNTKSMQVSNVLRVML
eukprot:1157700-Pelagomonas_calceolata.AAC.3